MNERTGSWLLDYLVDYLELTALWSLQLDEEEEDRVMSMRACVRAWMHPEIE